MHGVCIAARTQPYDAIRSVAGPRRSAGGLESVVYT